MVHPVEIDILGPLRVRATSTPAVRIRPGRPRRLLAVLAVRAGGVVSSDVLIDLLWGERLPQHPGNALQMQVSYLRRTLAAAADVQIEGLRGGYRLVIDREAVDAHRFEALVAKATASSVHDPDAALVELASALALWRGAALEDLSGHPLAAADVARLEELRLVAVERRNDLALGAGQHVDLLAELSELVAAHPLRERFAEQLVLALYRAGRQADALATYRKAREHLVEELGLEPGPALRALEGGVLRHDPALAWPPEESSRVHGHQPAAADSGGTVRDPLQTETSPRATASWLPVPLTRLIGRDDERRRVLKLIREHRVVTLTGPGGAGKTRLALAVADELAATTSVWFVDLGGATPASAPATVAAALGVALAPETDPGQAVSEALARRTGVVLLDTCEHVVDKVAALCAAVLHRAAGVRVLATSRRALNLTGEITWPVPPLPQAPPQAEPGMAAAAVEGYAASELFIERARALRPDFTLDATTAADVVAICQALDGLPLAIELAAATVDVLSTSAIRERLSRPFDVLVGGGVDGGARQQTMRAAMDWSYALLEPAQQRYFARLSVFPATFDLDAAAAVAPAGSDALALLSALVRQSMVVALGGDRYRLLDTIRSYARVMLDPRDRDDVVGVHAQHYTAVVARADPEIRGPDQVRWLATLRADAPNLRAALEHYRALGDDPGRAQVAAHLAWFWTLDGMLQEAADHLRAAAGSEQLPPLLRHHVLFGLGLVEASLGQLDRAEAIGLEARQLSEELAADGISAAPVGGGLLLLGVVAWARGDLDAAIRHHEDAMRVAAAGGDDWISAVAGVLRARTAVDAGAPDRRERITDGLQRAEHSGDRHILGIGLEQLARLELRENRLEAALQAARQAIEQHTLIGYPEGMVAALQPLGWALLMTGDHQGAWTAHRRALQLATSIGHPAAVCEAIEDLASVHEFRGEHRAALTLLIAAASRRTVHGMPARAGWHQQLDQRITGLLEITGLTTEALVDTADQALDALLR